MIFSLSSRRWNIFSKSFFSGTHKFLKSWQRSKPCEVAVTGEMNTCGFCPWEAWSQLSKQAQHRHKEETRASPSCSLANGPFLYPSITYVSLAPIDWAIFQSCGWLFLLWNFFFYFSITTDFFSKTSQAGRESLGILGLLQDKRVSRRPLRTAAWPGPPRYSAIWLSGKVSQLPGNLQWFVKQQVLLMATCLEKSRISKWPFWG